MHYAAARPSILLVRLNQILDRPRRFCESPAHILSRTSSFAPKKGLGPWPLTTFKTPPLNTHFHPAQTASLSSTPAAILGTIQLPTFSPCTSHNPKRTHALTFPSYSTQLLPNSAYKPKKPTCISYPNLEGSHRSPLTIRASSTEPSLTQVLKCQLQQ